MPPIVSADLIEATSQPAPSDVSGGQDDEGGCDADMSAPTNSSLNGRRRVRDVSEREIAIALVIELAQSGLHTFALLGFYDDDADFLYGLSDRLRVPNGKEFCGKLTRVTRRLVRYGVLFARMRGTQKEYVGEPAKQMDYGFANQGKASLLTRGKTEHTGTPEWESDFLLRHAYPAPDPELLYCWAVPNCLSVLVPKKRGNGFLRVPYGHHHDEALSRIAAAAGCDVFGLDGSLDFVWGGVDCASEDVREALASKVIPCLELHYGLSARLVTPGEFWRKHPIGPKETSAKAASQMPAPGAPNRGSEPWQTKPTC